MTEHNLIKHLKIIDIAWGDMDALGHVNNSRYFDYFQEARIEWLKQLNISMTESTGPVVIQVSATYHKPVIYPATIQIKSHIHSLGNSSMVMDHFLYQGETLMTEGMSKIVWVDYKLGKSVSLPENIRAVFNNS